MAAPRTAHRRHQPRRPMRLRVDVAARAAPPECCALCALGSAQARWARAREIAGDARAEVGAGR